MDPHIIRLHGPWSILDVSSWPLADPIANLAQVDRGSMTRLRVPWNGERPDGLAATTGRLLLLRPFNRPTGLDERSSVALKLDVGSAHTELWLNQTRLGDPNESFEISGLLENHNRLALFARLNSNDDRSLAVNQVQLIVRDHPA